MILRDPQMLDRVMQAQDMTQARLGRSTGVSRQFIHQLLSGHRRSCSAEIAALIEAALNLRPGVLFVTDSAGAPAPTRLRPAARAAAA